MNIKNKRILITSGPTWISIDGVRVISNLATGKTGTLLAEKLRACGAKVTLLIGPVTEQVPGNIRTIRFKFFDELKEKLLREIRTGCYDIIIHSAAVSDYRPVKGFSQKIHSGLKRLKIEFRPTVKIINLIKTICPKTILVAFKFEPGILRSALVKEGVRLMRQSRADFVVANSSLTKSYKAFIIDSFADISRGFNSKEALSEALVAALKNYPDYL